MNDIRLRFLKIESDQMKDTLKTDPLVIVSIDIREHKGKLNRVIIKN